MPAAIFPAVPHKTCAKLTFDSCSSSPGRRRRQQRVGAQTRNALEHIATKAANELRFLDAVWRRSADKASTFLIAYEL
jgi:hypothetical protein